jgi:hypothetical protein
VWRGIIGVWEVRVEYGKHWRQRLSATIYRGRVMVVAVVVAWKRGRRDDEVPE